MKKSWPWMVAAASVLMSGTMLATGADAAGKKDKPVTPVEQPAPVRPNFNGIWVMADYDLVYRPEMHNPPYTPKARANMERYLREFDRTRDDPAQYCVLMGMPWRMLNLARDYPLEIYQTPDRVIMLFEGHDDKRSIHIGRTTVPENLPQSANGWSNAQWDGDTLVITTSNVTPRTDINPLMRSEEAVITERWTKKVDPKYGDIIDVDMTIVDPPIYTEPVKGHQVYRRAPAGVEVGGYNCADDLWDKHLIAREAEIAAAKAKAAKAHKKPQH